MGKNPYYRNKKELWNNVKYDGVRISHDLTRREREQDAALWMVAKNLYIAGKGRQTVVGPPWKRRIVEAREPQSPTGPSTQNQTEGITADNVS